MVPGPFHWTFMLEYSAYFTSKMVDTMTAANSSELMRLNLIKIARDV
jgi:hypothetical protein